MGKLKNKIDEKKKKTYYHKYPAPFRFFCSVF